MVEIVVVIMCYDVWCVLISVSFVGGDNMVMVVLFGVGVSGFLVVVIVWGVVWCGNVNVVLCFFLVRFGVFGLISLEDVNG